MVRGLGEVVCDRPEAEPSSRSESVCGGDVVTRFFTSVRLGDVSAFVEHSFAFAATGRILLRGVLERYSFAGGFLGVE